MKEKKIQHNKIEKCLLSKKSIDTETDRYAILMECEGDEIISAKFYKADLLNELVSGNAKKIKEELMERHKNLASSMLGGLKEALLGRTA